MPEYQAQLRFTDVFSPMKTTQNTTAIKDVSDEITASAMRDLDQAHNSRGATNLNQQVSTFIL